MTYRRIFVAVLAVGLTLSACSSEPPPPPPPPAPTGPSQEELDQMRADSIAAVRAAAEEARREEEARVAREEEVRQRAVDDARETLTAMVFFEYDMSRITPEAEQILRQKVGVLRASPNVYMRMEGHADERGSNEYNLALGSRRAESVIALITGFGINVTRFETVSYGEERPLVNRSDEAAWSQNRRVEFVITRGMNEINPARVP